MLVGWWILVLLLAVIIDYESAFEIVHNVLCYIWGRVAWLCLCVCVCVCVCVCGGGGASHECFP